MISLLHPSRGRADKALATHRRWIDRTVNRVEHILSVDMNDPEPHKYIKNFGWHNNLIVKDNRSVVDATNHAAKRASGDILIYMSDDFDCPEGWDALIENEFEGVTKPMLLKVDDCLQDFKVGVVTIPMMNRQLFDLLGYFWFPEYYSMHVDVDLYETCKKIGAIKYAPHLKFPHNHYSNGKAPRDETYTRSEANWNQGLEVINRRRRQGFPI
jgi:glycosyltransferase involved in cell wall biosynthesis